MALIDPHANPLLSDSPRVWDELMQSIGPASLLVAIESRIGRSLRRTLSADDILQEALLQAWNSRRTFEWHGVKSFRSWLLTIIDHRISDAADWQSAVKRGGKGQSLSLENAPASDGQISASANPVVPPALVDSTTPSRLAIYREQAVAMQAALGELPEGVREVVRMRLIEQMPLEVIAQTLGLGVAAVRHRFRKGAEMYYRRLKFAPTSQNNGLTNFASKSAPAADRISASDE